MSRGANNFPPRQGAWRSRSEDFGSTPSNTDSNHMRPVFQYSRSYHVVPDALGSTPAPWRPVEGTILTRVLGLDNSFLEETRPVTRIRILNNDMARDTDYGTRHLTRYSDHVNQHNAQAPRIEDDSKLTEDEQNKALKKLKRERYTPGIRSLTKRISLFYRDKDKYRSNNDNDEDCKRCAVCLDDFEPNQEVMITPCNHMFHEDCIVPWVKSNGQCPVCRFVIYDHTAQRGSSINNNNVANVARNVPSAQELASLMMAMEEALVLHNLVL